MVSWLPFRSLWKIFWYLALLLGSLQDPLLDGSLADEAVDCDLFGLAQPVSPVHGLLVYRGVPIAVVEDDLVETFRNLGHLKVQVTVRLVLDGGETHGVGGGEVDAEASGSRTEQEDKDVRPAGKEGRR